MRIDLYCRVIDNFGDIGVCWRLACDLASRGHGVRLYTDDATALAWMAPGGAPGVDVRAWESADTPSDIVIEAFGCDPPPAFVAAMAARPQPPAWINLEYLSAEGYVERSHGLPSPQSNGLVKRFYYPGFTAATGGLLREPGLMAARQAFERAAWLREQGITLHPGERLVSYFAYPKAPLGALLDRLGDAPTLLVAPGAALPAHPRVRTLSVPRLSQTAYDRLLWASDLNFVRGEDSFVRAQWAGAPFVWHIYPQDDGAHGPKLDAFLARSGAAPDVAAFWRAWNGLRPGPLPALPEMPAWRQAAENWRDRLLGQPDLVTQLLDFLHRSKTPDC